MDVSYPKNFMLCPKRLLQYNLSTCGEYWPYHKPTKKIMFERCNSRITFLVTLVCTICIICTYKYTNYSQSNSTQLTRLVQLNENLTNQLVFMMGERNVMSRQLNEEIKKTGQLECKLTNSPGQKKVKESGTTSRGGYCYRTKHYTFDGMVRQLADLFEGKTVGSFGDGLGEYKKRIMKTGKPKLYDAYDGAPLCDEQSNGTVKFLDLSIPQYGLPLYDWVVSIEVAEHIPRAYEHIYMENLVRHAREGIVNSWATPGQKGFYHVNGRDIKYVIALFKSYGFEHDAESSEQLQQGAGNPNLKKNTNVYKRNNLWSIHNLKYYV